MYLKITRMICVGFGPYHLNRIPEGALWAEVKLTTELLSAFHKHLQKKYPF